MSGLEIALAIVGLMPALLHYINKLLHHFSPNNLWHCFVPYFCLGKLLIEATEETSFAAKKLKLVHERATGYLKNRKITIPVSLNSQLNVFEQCKIKKESLKELIAGYQKEIAKTIIKLITTQYQFRQEDQILLKQTQQHVTEILIVAREMKKSPYDLSKQIDHRLEELEKRVRQIQVQMQEEHTQIQEKLSQIQEEQEQNQEQNQEKLSQIQEEQEQNQEKLPQVLALLQSDMKK
eukprot:TRINITY_DN5080_c0_g1_i13.p1 TRINITY_DN5080_c0_g1~~TRINITY_DN5080_c0_g1_i13.p1  ORF type:complete len:236 (-),score=49.98 TRINITY_DN5080_c0_g1_i13:48-755(-)